MKAVSIGHWHSGQNFAPEKNLGVWVFAAEITVLSEGHRRDYGEYFIAAVKPGEITFEKKPLSGREDCI